MGTSKLKGDGVEFANLATRPTSPPSGLVFFNTSTSKLEIWDGNSWANVSDGASFLYRQIITTGFVIGGYQSTSPWTNINTMVHSTDVMTNNGNILPYAASYTSGACSLVNGYLWSADNSWPGTSAQTAAFNMNTMTGFSGTSYNMRNGRNDSATVFKEHQYAYIIGGGATNVDVFNLSTETMMGDLSITAQAGDTFQAGNASHSSEFSGFVWQATDSAQKITFSNSTATATVSNLTAGASTSPGINSQQKGFSSKHGKGYGGNEGSYLGGFNLRRWSYATDTNIGTVTKPLANSGEENYDMGQDHQYAMGCYDGVQNNRGHKFSYATDSGVELGSGSIRTGVPGGSSGHCVWKG